MTVDKLGVIQFCAVLVVGVGGALGAQALGAPDLAGMVLAFCGGLLIPMRSLRTNA
jgi:hypothetical protein